MPEQTTHARPDPIGRQVIEIAVRHGYRPRSIAARAGLPLRIIFDRQDDEPCTERVVFSSPRLERRLAADGPTVIDLPAQPPGEIRFTCAMGRYRGSIRLVEESRGTRIDRLRLGKAFDSAGAVAIVLWLITLPLVVLLSIALLDVGMAVVAAVLSLAGWLVGCQWVFGQSRSRA